MAHHLTDIQRALLIAIVEADRATPANSRQPFVAVATATSWNLDVMHPGLDPEFEAYPADLKSLGDAGFVRRHW